MSGFPLRFVNGRAGSHKPRGTFGLDGVVTERRGRFAVSAKPDRTVDGTLFDSKKEATRYAELKLLQRAGEIECLEIQPSWNIEINGKHYCRYSADFSYIDKRRGSIIEEVKSTGTAKDAAYRLRRKAAELAHGIVVTEVLR